MDEAKEPTPEIVQVQFTTAEASREFHEFMASFIARRSGVTIEPVEEDTKPRLNERYVTMLKDKQNQGEIVPVIMLGNLEYFEDQEAQKTGNNRQGKSWTIFTAINRKYSAKYPQFFYFEPGTSRSTAESAYPILIGIRAEQVMSLYRILETQYMHIPKVGERTMEFFRDFCETLHKPES